MNQLPLYYWVLGDDVFFSVSDSHLKSGSVKLHGNTVGSCHTQFFHVNLALTNSFLYGWPTEALSRQIIDVIRASVVIVINI